MFSGKNLAYQEAASEPPNNSLQTCGAVEHLLSRLELAERGLKFGPLAQTTHYPHDPRA